MTVAIKRENIDIFERWKVWVAAECQKRFNGRGDAVSDKFAELFMGRNRLPHPSKGFINKLIAEAEREVARKIKPRGTSSIDDSRPAVEIIDDVVDENDIVEMIDRNTRIQKIERACGTETALIVKLLIQRYTVSEICQRLKIPKKEIYQTLQILAKDQEQENHSG